MHILKNKLIVNALVVVMMFLLNVFPIEILAVDTSNAIEAVNNATIKTMGQVITDNNAVLGLDLEGQYSLVDDKTIVYEQLTGKNFVNIIDIQTAFNNAVNSLLSSYNFKAVDNAMIGTAGYLPDRIHRNNSHPDMVTNSKFYNMLMRFDLNSVTSNSNIDKIVLGMTNKDAAGSNFSYTVNGLYGSDTSVTPNRINSWVHNTVTFNTRPANEVQVATGSAPKGTTSEFDVTSYVQSRIADDDKIITLMFTTTGSDYIFYALRTTESAPYVKIYTKKPQMLSSSIDDLETNVSIKTDTITIEFNKDMDESTIVNSNIKVSDETTNQLVDYNLQYDNKKAIIKINNRLDLGTDYKITMDNLMSAYNEPMRSKVIRFTTEHIVTYLDLSETKNALVKSSNESIVIKASKDNGEISVLSPARLQYVIGNPDVLSVDSNGKLIPKKRGFSLVDALFTNSDDTIINQTVAVVVYNKIIEENFEDYSGKDSAFARSGVYSFKANGIYNNIITANYQNALAEGWFYDDMANDKNGNYINLKSSRNDIFKVGIDNASDSVYSYVANNQQAVTTIKRTKGWHQVIFDYLEDELISIYIDGQKIFQGQKPTSETYSLGTEGTEGNFYYDDFRIYDVIGTKPVANNVVIRGSMDIGSTAVGYYGYLDDDGDVEDGTQLRWLISDTSSSSFNPIQGEVQDKLVIKPAYEGKYIKFEVTPANLYVKGRTYSYVMQVKTETKSTEKTAVSIRVGGGGGSIIYPTPVPPLITTDTKTFIDVPNEFWAKNDIEQMVARGIVKGIDEKHFSPNSNITRAEFVALINRALNNEKARYKATFVDVSENDWYADDIQTSLNLGIVSGFDGKFRPNDTITREEIVKIIVEALKVSSREKDYKVGIIKFFDEEEISSWAKEYVAIASELGIIEGIGDEKFAPKQNASRAQAIVMIKRFLEKK